MIVLRMDNNFTELLCGDFEWIYKVVRDCGCHLISLYAFWFMDHVLVLSEEV